MRKLINNIVAPCLLVGLFTGCSELGESESVAAKQEMSVVSATQTDTAVLGFGYHPDRQKLMAFGCVTGPSELRGSTSSTLTYKKDMNYNDVLNTLAGDLSVGLNLAVVSAEASAKYASENASTELSETHHLKWVGVQQKQVFAPNAVVLTAKGAQYAGSSGSLLENQCGKEFITEVHRGASLFATLKVEFFNSKDRLEVGGKINVSVAADLVEVDGSLTYVDEEIKKRTKISVMVKQVGGIPQRLTTILSADILSCTLDKPAACVSTFKNLINYAKTDFSNQLNDLNNWAVLKYVTQSYSDSGIDDLVPSAGYAIVEDVVKQKIALIEQNIRQALADESRANSLLTTGAPYMTTTQREKVRAIAQKAANNYTTYLMISEDCYRTMGMSCLTTAQTLEASIQPYNPKDLDVKPPIKGDITEDGCVDEGDWNIFAASYGYSTSSGLANPAADFNKDGWVDSLDYLIIAEHWYQGC